MRQAAAYRATLARLLVADMNQGGCKQLAILFNETMLEHTRLSGQTTDPDCTILAAHIVQTVDKIDVDQMCRLRQSKVHQGHQTLPAGENFGVIAELAQQFQRLIELARSVIYEIRWFQRRALLLDFKISRIDLPFSPRVSLRADGTKHQKLFTLVIDHFVHIVAMAAFWTGDVEFRWHRHLSLKAIPSAGDFPKLCGGHKIL
jgi:hypothetical protein